MFQDRRSMPPTTNPCECAVAPPRMSHASHASLYTSHVPTPCRHRGVTWFCIACHTAALCASLWSSSGRHVHPRRRHMASYSTQHNSPVRLSMPHASLLALAGFVERPAEIVNGWAAAVYNEDSPHTWVSNNNHLISLRGCAIAVQAEIKLPPPTPPGPRSAQHVST